MKLGYEVTIDLPDVEENDLGLALERATRVMIERLDHDEEYGFPYKITYGWAMEVDEGPDHAHLGGDA